MAIKCTTPSTLESEIKAVYDVVTIKGATFLTNFKSNIELLEANWTGEDANTNISDLVNVYNGVKDDLSIVMRNVVDTNNGPVSALVKDYIADGGTAPQPSDIYIKYLGDDLYHKGIREYEVKDGFIAAAETFEKIPGEFQTFVDEFKEKTAIMFKNWENGASRWEIYEQFNKIETYFTDTCYSTLEKVKKNIVTVKTNKQGLMND